MGRAWVCLVAASGLLAATTVWAYIPTVTSSGGSVTWRGALKLNLAGNPINRNGIDADDFYRAVVRSLQRWQYASDGRVRFDYWQGTDPDIYIPNSEYNGLSSVYFASNATSNPHLSPNVLGLTQVWYDTSSGKILETDVVLNDRNFHFTTNPQDTSGYGSGGPTGNTHGGQSNVFIENVLTHELGHAFGLSHSGGLQSTMLFMESPEQAHLGCDEQIAIHALYPSGDAADRGAISGAVVSESGRPVFGAHVVAISRHRGTVMATGLTNSSGHYQIAALEPGAYFLMVEPYYAGPAALPLYYSGMNNGICPGGSEFVRSFLVDDSGSIPQAVQVDPNRPSGAPTLVARCQSAMGADVQSATGSSHYVGAPEIFNGGGSGFGVTQKFDVAGSAYFRLSAVSGHLEVHAVSYSLYSPIHTSLTLLDADGQHVGSAEVSQHVYTGDSGYVNYDSQLVADGLPPGNYTIQVQPSALDSTRYPAGTVALDAASFVLLTGSVNEPAPPLASVIADNARCRMAENFASYSSPDGNPPRNSIDSGAGGGFGFCGSIADSNRRGGGDGGGPTPGGMAGWFLPWVAMLGFARLAKMLARTSRRGNGLTLSRM